MYTITFPIPCFLSNQNTVTLPTGLARDILTQLKYEPQLRLIAPSAADAKFISDPYEIDLNQYPGLSFRMLPWDGNLRKLPLKWLAIKTALIEEARRASVWHTACSTKLWDLTTISYNVGRHHAKGLRVLCLDSDPASMLESSGSMLALQGKVVRSRYQRWVSEVDATIFVGQGAKESYGAFTPHSIMTGAVWLQNGDLAEPETTRFKFQASLTEPVRIALPTRLTAWKGVDDVILALKEIGDQLPPWQLDIIGEGPEKARLAALASPLGEKIQFLDSLPYGTQFFTKLRSYHFVFVPTRGLEEARIAYDAAASGCALIHSNTTTLQSVLAGLKPRWNFEPGNLDSLKASILLAFQSRSAWVDAGLAGIELMRGRTIDEMHSLRSNFLRPLRHNSEERNRVDRRTLTAPQTTPMLGAIED